MSLPQLPVDVFLGWAQVEQTRQPIYDSVGVTFDMYFRDYLRAVKNMRQNATTRRFVKEAEAAERTRDTQAMQWALENLVLYTRGTSVVYP